MRWWSIGLVVAACGSTAPPAAPAITASEGIAIAMYSGFAVVDDRRTIEVIDGTITLDRIDATAPLQALVIEGLGEPMRVQACTRERIDDSAGGLASFARARDERPKRIITQNGQRFAIDESASEYEPPIFASTGVLSPLVHCRVAAQSGKHHVRVMQVTTSLTFQTRHDVTITDPDRATFTTRFAIVTPNWHDRAAVTLYEGAPGEGTPPIELATGTIVLDASTALLAAAPRTLGVRIRSVYDGAKLDEDQEIKPDDIVWGRESRHQVWVWLEVNAEQLPAGPLRAHVELPNQPIRDVEVPAGMREELRDVTRWPLWIDEDLLGSRQRIIDRADGVVITDRLQLSISNLGTQTREVFVEERLRPSKRRTVTQAWPSRPTMLKSVARQKLVLAPGKTERMGFTIDYEF